MTTPPAPKATPDQWVARTQAATHQIPYAAMQAARTAAWQTLDEYYLESLQSTIGDAMRSSPYRYDRIMFGMQATVKDVVDLCTCSGVPAKIKRDMMFSLASSLGLVKSNRVPNEFTDLYDQLIAATQTAYETALRGTDDKKPRSRSGADTGASR